MVRRRGALPLVPLYWAGLGVKTGLFDCGLLPTHHLAVPVISVGGLSAGGAGKTPLVKLLANLCARHGMAVDVLSRGYGRRSQVVEQVDPEGTAEHFGDEPLEMARSGLKVFLGAERYEAGRLAELVGGPRLHLLDDGFQHRQLFRALDIVLLTAADRSDGLLPAGNLREPFSALRRASVVVLREEEAQDLVPLVRLYTGAAVWVVRRWIELPEEQVSRPVVFCGIARPESFLGMLEASGVKPVGTLLRPDHHLYTREDVELLVELALHVGANGFYTTAKDAVKLGAAMLARLEEVGPVGVVELKLALGDEQMAWRLLERLVEAHEPEE